MLATYLTHNTNGSSKNDPFLNPSINALNISRMFPLVISSPTSCFKLEKQKVFIFLLLLVSDWIRSVTAEKGPVLNLKASCPPLLSDGFDQKEENIRKGGE